MKGIIKLISVFLYFFIYMNTSCSQMPTLVDLALDSQMKYLYSISDTIKTDAEKLKFRKDLELALSLYQGDDEFWNLIRLCSRHACGVSCEENLCIFKLKRNWSWPTIALTKLLYYGHHWSDYDYDLYIMVKILMTILFNINNQDEHGDTFLMYALSWKESAIHHFKIYSLMIKTLILHNDINLNCCNERGYSALCIALNEQYVDAVRLLLAVRACAC